MNIQDALGKFMVQLEADGRSNHTIDQYCRHVCLFSHWAHDVGLCGDVFKISHEDIAKFLTSPQGRMTASGGIKKATSMNALRTSLKGFFSYLHKAGFVYHNPTRLTRRAICGTSPPRSLSQAEQDRLMAVLASGTSYEARRDHALFHLMLGTGIRLGSAVGLDVEDVDLERCELWLHTTKGNRPIRIFLNHENREHLRKYLADQFPGPLFTNREGRRLTARHVQRRFAMWLERAGIRRKASVHSLRHSFGQQFYDKTHDILLTQAALHHRSIKSTLVYARVDNSRLKKAIES